MKKTIFIIAVLLSVQAAAQDGRQLRLDIDRCRQMALENNSAAVNAGLDVLCAK